MTGAYRNRLIGIAAYLMAVAALVAAVWWYGYGAALGQLETRARSDLALASNGLVSELERFRELAVLTADHPIVRGVFEGRETASAVGPTLQEIADKTGALRIALVDGNGAILAATLGAIPEGQSGTVAFERAMDGALGVDHLSGPQFGPRVFVFAAPIFTQAGPVVGALIVSADVEAVEVSWRSGAPVLFFTDEAGVVFLTSRSEMVLTSQDAGTFVAHTARIVHGHDIWQLDGGRYLPRRALHVVQHLPVIEMQGEALVDLAPARQLAF